MTEEHEKYLKIGITRILTHCDQWDEQDTREWDDHLSDVSSDLAKGRLDIYATKLKAAYHADKSKLKKCYIDDSYIISVIKMLKVYKEDYDKTKNNNNNKVTKKETSKNGERKNRTRDIKFNPEEEYVL